jgi:AraC family transcriptional regulator
MKRGRDATSLILPQYAGQSPFLSARMAWFSTIRLVDYEPNSRIGRHAHGEASLSLIVDGGYHEHIQGRGATHAPGHMLYCPAHEEHAQSFAASGARQAQVTPTAECMDFLGDALDRSAAAFRAGTNFSILARRMAAELRRNDPVTSLALEALALEAVTTFARSARIEEGAPPWLTRVDEFIRVHARRAFTIHEVARAAGCRVEDIGPAVRTKYGLTLGGLVRRRRLEDAARLLASDEVAINAVALDCGFCDQAHLTRAFKSAYGVTPGAFRRMRSLPASRSKRR